jgi:TctA family transporter
MYWPLRIKKIRDITALVLFLIIGLVALFFAQYESPAEKAIQEWAGGPERTLWTLWPIYATVVVGACGLYILFFKVEKRRQIYLGLLIQAAVSLCLILIPSWWNLAIGLAVMLALILIGWLYPARNIDRESP